MTKRITNKLVLFLLLLTFCFRAQDALAANAAQTNFNFGIDTPSSSATDTSDSYIFRFQIEQVQQLFTPRFSFGLVFGTGVTGGEVNVGLVAYPVYKARSDLPIQPYLGVEGGAFIGTRNKVVGLNPGVSALGGADIKIGKKFGITIEAAYLMYSNQDSARIFGGISYTNL